MKVLPLLCAAALAALPPAQETHIEITSGGFSPVIVELQAGRTVVWTNADDTDHTVTEGRRPKDGQDTTEMPLFDSGRIRPGGTFAYTFTRPGTYLYRSTLGAPHAGKIIIVPAP